MKIEGLEYFVGKICTIFTVPTNRDFKSENPQTFPQPIFHYFVGKIIEISTRGILIEQWNNEKRLRTFFFIDHIISISEEEILDPSDPKDLKLIEEYKQVNEKTMKKATDHVEELKRQKEKTDKNPYVDIGALSQFNKTTS
jgi:hypothetical protein